MKKILLAVMVLTSLVSCGKNNSVGAVSGAGITNPLIVTGTVETQLASIINNNQFGNGYVIVNNYQETWNRYISQMPGLTYKYGTSSCGSSGFCYNFFGSTNVTTTVTRTVINSNVDITAKKNELIGLINNRSWVQQYSSTVAIVQTKDGTRYVIDTALPLQANPVSTTTAAGVKEDFLGASI